MASRPLAPYDAVVTVVWFAVAIAVIVAIVAAIVTTVAYVVLVLMDED